VPADNPIPSLEIPAGNASFEITRWSVVLAAKGPAPGAQAALTHLCNAYWYPIYAFIRRQRNDAHHAQDLTQEFFSRLLEKGWLDGVTPEKGRFRSFLLAAVKHFLSNQRAYQNAQKRGGGKAAISLDAQTAESRYSLEPATGQTPEKIFERRWALALLEQVLGKLKAEMSDPKKAALFEQLKPALTGQPMPHADIAAQLGMTEGAVKVAAHRLRARYRELIREEVAQTVASEEEIEEELRDLMSALSS
jgi:RNA polymerase sigma-70 factor (ECF subfamily)